MQPNVIVFFTDQQRADSVGALGGPEGLTPNLDLMATRGTTFENACTTNPVCAPSRSALLTGRYPTQTGVFENGIALDASLPTMARGFKEAGYRTGYIGKWHLSEENPVPADERADWDHWLASNVLEFTSDAYRTVVWDENDQAVELPGYRSDAIADAAIRFIADNSDKPFFLFVSLIEPHHQNEHDDYPAPEVYRDAFRNEWVPPDLRNGSGTAPQHIAGYYGQIRRVDEGFGRIRDALRSLELDDSTVVAYTADHGSHFKTRNSEYKRSCHDSSIRVPLIVSGPTFPAGLRVAAPVSTVDLASTLLAAAGLDALDGTQGAPLQRLIPFTDSECADPALLVQISENETGRAVRTARWTYYVAADGPARSASEVYQERELYDLDSDPYQQDNLIGSVAHAEVAAGLRAKLVALVREIEGAEATVAEFDRRDQFQRRPETTVRETGLRGDRFGHRPLAASR